MILKTGTSVPSFLQNGQRLVASVKKPALPSKDVLLETNTAEEVESAQQPNLDQDKHDRWLASLSREQISSLASRVGELARSKEQSGKFLSKPGLPSKTSLPD